jgi:hypothetical protein
MITLGETSLHVFPFSLLSFLTITPQISQNKKSVTASILLKQGKYLLSRGVHLSMQCGMYVNP